MKKPGSFLNQAVMATKIITATSMIAIPATLFAYGFGAFNTASSITDNSMVPNASKSVVAEFVILKNRASLLRMKDEEIALIDFRMNTIQESYKGAFDTWSPSDRAFYQKLERLMDELKLNFNSRATIYNKDVALFPRRMTNATEDILPHRFALY